MVIEDDFSGQKMRIYLFSISIVILGCIFAKSLSAGLYQERSKFLRNVSWVYLEMINLEKEDAEKLENFRNSLKKDVISMFGVVGVMVKLTEKKEDIVGHDYLKIRVHKIVLERTVYLSAIEIVAMEENDPKEKASLRYTDVFDRFESVQPVIANRIEKMLNWYIMK